jgi:gluconate 2-dehydrogenase gamma chain
VVEVQRRSFILSAIVISSAWALKKDTPEVIMPIEQWHLIKKVQNILLPKQNGAPGADEFGATNYLINVMGHPSFNVEDSKFILRGAKELLEREKHFVSLSIGEQEKALEAFAQTQFGENWLAYVLFYTLEALLSDPIYGGNIDEIGWKWLGHNTGKPRPTVQFGAIT